MITGKLIESQIMCEGHQLYIRHAIQTKLKFLFIKENKNANTLLTIEFTPAMSSMYM